MRKINILILALIIIRFSAAQTFTWQVVSTMPIPVKGAKAVVIDSLIYVVGGYSDSLQADTKIIQEFNPQSKTWRIAGYLNENRSGLVAKNHHDSIIICGGVSINTPYLFGMEIWASYPSITTATIYNYNFNFNRLFAASEISNNHLYLIGGVPGGSFIDTINLPYIVEYNIPEARVTYVNNNLFALRSPFHQMSVLLSNEILIFGGVYNTISNEIYKFNTQTHIHQKLPLNLINARAGGVALSNGNGSVYILGGFNEAQQSLSTTEIFTYDSSGYHLQSGPPLIVPRSECTAVMWDSTIYVFGGINANGQVTQVVERLNIVSAITDDKITPERLDFELYQNYPNPFNPSTTISWNLTSSNHITLKIFDILGNELATLIDEYQYAGFHKFQFSSNQNNHSNQIKHEGKLPSAVYIYQLRAGNHTITKKMLLLK